MLALRGGGDWLDRTLRIPRRPPGLAPPPDEVPAPQIIGRPSEVEPLLERAGQRAVEVERQAAQDIEQFASQQVAEAEASEGFATAAEAAAGAAEAAAAAEGGGMLAALGEGALATAGAVGAATGGLAVAGAGAALVGTAWAIEGGLNAASHLMGWGAATGGGTDSDASRPSMTTDVQTLNGTQESGAVDHYFIQEQRRAQRPEVFRSDTESESEPRNRPLPQIRSRPARRPRPEAQTRFGLNNVPIPVSSGSERSRVSRQQVTQAVNDELVASLDYKLATGNTNYIQSRKSVQFFPSSLSTFTPSTSRVCRIPITPGSDFVDPESIKLAFTFRNTDGSSDMLCGSPDPSCFIERIQLFANGQRVEDISYYGRSCFMYSLLKPSDWWTELHWEGLPVDAGGWALPVQPGQKRDVLMYPHLIGMFNSGKMLPPQLNLVLEIEFADPEIEPVVPDRKRAPFGRPGHPGQRTAGVLRAHTLVEQIFNFQLPQPPRAAVLDPGGLHELQHHRCEGFHEDARGFCDVQQDGRKPRVQLRISRRSLPQRHGGHRHGRPAAARGDAVP